MDKLNTGEMQDQAKKLLEKKNRMEEQCKACDRLIQQLNQHCEDAAYTKFAARYNAYKPTMENICSWLESYRSFIVGVSDSYDEFVRKAMSQL